MDKPIALILHPKEWATSKYGKNSRFDFHHVSIGGKIPKKRNGVPTFDGYADCATLEGMQAARTLFTQLRPAIFFFWMHGDFPPSFLIQLKRISPKTKFVHWFGNHRHSVVGNVTRYQRTLDMLFLNSKDPRQIKMYKKIVPHVKTLYDGFAPSEVKLVENKPEFDCFFGGNSYMGAIIGNKKLDFPGGKIRFDLICEAHKQFKLHVTSGYSKFWPFKVQPEVFHPHYTTEMRRAKITLNVNHFPTLYKAYTRRTIRSIFARRCHITLYIPGMEEDFENHKHLVWFKTVDEGIDLIKYYLDHDTEREEIAWAGWKLAMKKYTFHNRMEDFDRFTKVLVP